MSSLCGKPLSYKQEVLRRKYWQLPAIVSAVFIISNWLEMLQIFTSNVSLGMQLLMCLNAMGSACVFLSALVLAVQIDYEKDNAIILLDVVFLSGGLKLLALAWLYSLSGMTYIPGLGFSMTIAVILTLYLGTIMSGYSVKHKTDDIEQLMAYRKEVTGFQHHAKAAYRDWNAKTKK